MALKTKFAPLLMIVSRKAASGRGAGARGTSAVGAHDAHAHGAGGRRARARMTRASRTVRRSRRARGERGRAGGGGRGYVPGELFCVGLYGWFELRNTVYTLSTLASFSKNGIKSNSSESVMSSNHDATGTWKEYTCRLFLFFHVNDG